MTKSTKEKNKQENQKSVVVYQPDDGQVEFDVNIDQETVWLTQAQMSELFGRTQPVISRHIKNTFKEGELNRDSVYADFAYTASDGKVYQVEHYNLDVIISVGYRVKSKRGTQFRIWATKILRNYAVEKKYKETQKKVLSGESYTFNFINSPVTISGNTVDLEIPTTINIGDFEEQKKELTALFEKYLNSKYLPNLYKQTIQTYKNEIKKMDGTKETKKTVSRFLEDLGDTESIVHQSLNAFGIAKSLLLDGAKAWASILNILGKSGL